MSGIGWQRLFDRTIHAYYEGSLAEGRTACEELLALPDVPADVREQARRNSVFYAPYLADLVSRCEPRRIDLPLAPGWFPLNPSIAADGDGYLMTVRSVDYEMLDAGRFRLHDPAGVSHTTNHLVRLDASLAIADIRPIADETGGAVPFPTWTGIEDCRLVSWRGGWVLAATVADRNPGRIGQMALVDLDAVGGVVRHLRLLSDWTTGHPEKNWMPLVRGDDLFFVYGCGPTVVLRYLPERAAVEEVARWPTSPLATALKGGSAAVAVAGGWLFAVHETADFPGGGRTYLHRFVRLDEAFRLTDLSAPFVFGRRGIEFCAGLARQGETLVASFGAGDNEAWLACLSLPEVLGLLRPVPPPASPIAAPAPSAAPLGRSPGEARARRQTALAAEIERLRTIGPAPPAGLSPPLTRLLASPAVRWLVSDGRDAPDPAARDDIVRTDDVDIGPMWTAAADREIGRWLREQKTWGQGEREFLQGVLRPGLNVVDIGANIGYFTRFFASAVGPEGRVLAVEPEPFNFALLEANVAMGGAANVELLPVAAGRRPGLVALSLDESGNLGGHGVVLRPEGATTEVAVYPADDLLDPEVPIHLVKIDAEGMDHAAVAGLGRTIGRWAPTLLVEFHPARIIAFGDDPAAVLAGYRAAGLEATILGWDALRLQAEAALDLAALVRANLRVPEDGTEFVRRVAMLGTVNLVLRPTAGLPRAR